MPERCPQGDAEEQRRDWPVEPDLVHTREDIDQNQKARDREGRSNRPGQARQPIRNEANPGGWLVSILNP